MSRISVSPTRRADVAVLKRNLELWPVFREVLSGFSVLELETIKTPLNVRDSFRIAQHVIADKASIGYASMAAQLQRSGVKVLLAVDQTTLSAGAPTTSFVCMGAGRRGVVSSRNQEVGEL
jgi:hypothetical protein